jgi:hypothetical protein
LTAQRRAPALGGLPTQRFGVVCRPFSPGLVKDQRVRAKFKLALRKLLLNVGTTKIAEGRYQDDETVIEAVQVGGAALSGSSRYGISTVLERDTRFW